MGSKVIAVVAGREVTEEEFAVFAANVSQEQQEFIKTPEGRKQALIQYTNYFLFEKLGEEKHYDKEADFIRILEGVRREILSQYALTRELQDIRATEEECRAYYEAHKEELNTSFEEAAPGILQQLTNDRQNEKYMAIRAELVEKYGLELK